MSNNILSKSLGADIYLDKNVQTHLKGDFHGVKATINKGNSKKAQEDAISEFESMFVHMLIKTMRNTVQKADFLHTTKGEDTYYAMFDMEIAKEISKKNGIGLKSLIKNGFDQVKGVEIDQES